MLHPKDEVQAKDFEMAVKNACNEYLPMKNRIKFLEFKCDNMQKIINKAGKEHDIVIRLDKMIDMVSIQLNHNSNDEINQKVYKILNKVWSGDD